MRLRATVASVAEGEHNEVPPDLNVYDLAAAPQPVPAQASSDVPPPVRSVADLLQQLDGRVHHTVVDLVRRAQLDEAVRVDADTAAAVVARFTWLLDRVGDDGIALTSAGYLPPREVQAAFKAFELDREWMGKASREVNVYPVLLIRQTSQRIGLLRKHRGLLLLTKRGSALRTDPLALWWQVAAALRRDDDSAEAHAGLVALLTVAAGEDPRSDRVTRLVREVLTGLGWRLPPPPPTGVLRFDPIDDLSVWLYRLLAHLGTALTDGPHFSHPPTEGGRLLARAALSLG